MYTSTIVIFVVIFVFLCSACMKGNQDEGSQVAKVLKQTNDRLFGMVGQPSGIR